MEQHAPETVTRLKRTVGLVAALNFGYFWIEITVALLIGSVALFADSVDFLEDTAVNLLILLGLSWSVRARAKLGKVLALVILLPAIAALAQAVNKFTDPTPPDPVSLIVTAGGAIVVNTICALILARYQDHVGAMSKAAYLAARNDVIANAAIIVAGVVMVWWISGWPDIVVGLGILALNLHAAKEVWEAATEEELVEHALAGEFDED